MIIDLQKFIGAEQPFWDELEKVMTRQEQDPYRRMSFDEIKRLRYLYERASADLAKLITYSAERALRLYLESLVGRAYSFMYGSRQEPVRFSPWQWFWRTFPATFRRRWRAFALSLAVMLTGGLFGGAAIVMDPEANAVLMPFVGLAMLGWFAARAAAKSSGVRTIAKAVFGPFVGLVFVIVLPFAGLATLAWIGGRALFEARSAA